MRLQFRLGSEMKGLGSVKCRFEIREACAEVSVAPACSENLLQNISLAAAQKEPGGCTSYDVTS